MRQGRLSRCLRHRCAGGAGAPGITAQRGKPARALVALAALVLALYGAPGHGRLCPPPLPAGGSDPVDDCRDVVRIECPAQGRVLTGFKARVEGRVGIVTALHGVVGCPDLTAFNLNDVYSGLRIARVDLALDAAFLSSAALAGEGDALQTLPALHNEELRVVGYPQGLQYQFSHRIEPQIPPLRRLFEMLPAAERNELESRGSPDIQETVLSLSGAIQNGYSGAPILTWDGNVVGIANGGLRGGTVDIGWAMPIWELNWEDARARESELTALAQGRPSALFGAEASPLSALPDLYVADGGDPVGRIYRVRQGELREIHRRPSGRIYSLAVAPDGGIYFSDHNDFHIYRLRAGKEERIYSHTTYTRNVRFDAGGRFYFSEASGAGRDGTIYGLNLQTGVATPVFRVRLGEIDGFWAGNFAFAPDGRLWLSSGNRIPASLYQVEGERLRRMLNAAGSITGLTFTRGGDLLYADWRQRLYRIELPGFVASEALHAEQLKWASDVAVATASGATPGMLTIKKPGVVLKAVPQTQRQVADSGDWVQILAATVSPDAPLRFGHPVKFTLKIRYSLKSASQARLVVSVGQLPAAATHCEGSGGSLVDAGETVIAKGSGSATVAVTWLGGKSAKQQVRQGHLAFYPSLWRTQGHSRIAYFGRTPEYCYRFNP